MRKSAAGASDWCRLDALVKKLSGSPAGRDPAELREFWGLYRTATSRLAALQSAAARTDEEFQLNRLVAAAHGVLYRRTTSTGGVGRLLRFLSRGWPPHMRRHGRLLVLSTAVFLAGAAFGAWYCATDAGFVGLVAGPDILASVDRGEMWTDHIKDAKPVFGAFLFSNNLTVAILAFALGITAGVGTTWILFMNGIMLGALGWHVFVNGMSRAFWGFVIAHGAVEIPAILVAGAAGYAIARGQLFPGALPWGRAIAAGGGVAIRIFAGAAVMLMFAAGLEAWFSPEPYPFAVKATVAAGVFLLWLGWLLLPGEDSPGELSPDRTPSFRPSSRDPRGSASRSR
ncbi:MAG: stage II sporulation protein M [bacterium]